MKLNKQKKLTRYSDWINIFKEINSNNNLNENYELLIQGKLKDKKNSYQLFIKELLNFVNVQLKKGVTNFSSNINRYLSILDYDSMFVIVNNFETCVQYIKFFEHLEFMNFEDKQQISSSIDENVEKLIKSINKKIREISDTESKLFEIEYLLQKKFRMHI